MNYFNKANINIFIGLMICLIGSGYVYNVRSQNEFDVSHSAQISKKLNRYYMYKNYQPKGKSYNSTIMVLDDGSKFWTDVVNDDSAADVLKGPDVKVVFYANLQSTARPKDGAIRAYGLWVNGTTIRTQMQDVEIENGALWILLGFCLFTGILLIWDGIYKKRRVTSTATKFVSNEKYPEG